MQTTTELERITVLFQEFVDLLQTERTALEQHDVAIIEAATAAKQNSYERINRYLSEHPELAAQIQTASKVSDKAEVDSDHTSLVALIALAREYNLVNGKILHRSQQSVREILGILSGKSLDGLYGQTGEQTAGTGNSAGAIARA